MSSMRPSVRKSPRKKSSEPLPSPPEKVTHAIPVQKMSSSSGKRSADRDLEPSTDRYKMQMVKESAISELRRRMQGLVEEGVITRAINIASKYPLLLGSDASSIQETLRSLYEDWNSMDLINISHAMSMCRRRIKDHMMTAMDNLSERLATTGAACRRAYDSQVSNAFSYQDKGMAMMKASLKNEKFPQPMEGDMAETIWPQAIWDRLVSEEENAAVVTGNKFRQEKVVQELLKHANFGQCEFELVFTGNHQTKAVGGFRPDMIFALKGFDITPYTAGAIISLTSKGGGARYDNKEDVGALCTYGEVLLKRAGPVRKSILLGITDLKMIRFFLLAFQQDSSHTGNPFVATNQSTPTASVRLSLCGLVASEHSALGIDDSSPVYWLLGSPWQANRFLGAGATSNVYEVEKDNQICALKMPVVDGSVLDKDETYLRRLQDVDCIPRLVERIGSMLVLEPVGKCVDRLEDMTEAGVYLGDLVDVLYSAHQRKIVNRDVRRENIMIAKSLVKKSMDKLFLLDWGFATMNDTSQSFEGSRVTASDEVLRQIAEGLPVVYRFVDDLVALVRCTYLLCHPDDTDHVYTLGIDGCRLFWKQKMQAEIWNRAEAAAIKCDYTTLGTLLTEIQLLYRV